MKHINKNKKFDVISLSHVLEHFNSPEKIHDCLSLLKKDGLIFIEVPNEEITFLNFCKTTGSETPHLMWFSTYAFEILSKKIGLEIIQNSVKTYGIKSSYMSFLPDNNPLKIKTLDEWKKMKRRTVIRKRNEWEVYEPSNFFSRYVPGRLLKKIIPEKKYAKMFDINYFNSNEFGSCIRLILKKS